MRINKFLVALIVVLTVLINLVTSITTKSSKLNILTSRRSSIENEKPAELSSVPPQFDVQVLISF